MEKEKLHILIQRYFDGETSLEEERILQDELLAVPAGDPLADEALAVMGFTRVKKREKRRSNGNGKWKRRNLVSIAAACVTLIAIGAGVVTYFVGNSNSFAHSECVAYIGGERIDNESVVMSMISEQLGEMSDASASLEKEINSDLNDFREIMDFD